MVRRCCVTGCRSSSHDRKGRKIDNGLRFHCFPAWRQKEGSQVSELSKRRRMAWVSAVRRTTITFDKIPISMRVCSLHFRSGEPAYEMSESDPDWVPSLHLGHIEITPTDTARHARQDTRKRRRTESTPKMEDTAAEAPTTQEDQKEAEGGAVVGETADRKPTTECDLCQGRLAEINCLLEQNRALKCELDKRKMDEEFLKDDNVKVKYYTGLPHIEALMCVLACVQPYLPQTSSVLSPFQMLFLTLIRLRLNLPIQHIAHLFQADRKTVSKTFSDVIHVLHTRISPLVTWPERNMLHVTMPHPFVEAFGKRVAVILDCCEIFTRRPSNLKAQAQSCSHYKRNASIKYLIGVTPPGTISFISKGWGGRASDKRITENSGILDKLLPGDLVLADHGFNIRDSVGLMCAEVKISAFTKGRYQLEAIDVENTQEIANLRIHVERVIGSIRNKYTMLSAKVPIRMVRPSKGEDMTFLDKIVTVCCALTNMSPSAAVKHS